MKARCSVEGCERPMTARGHCHAHRQRVLRHGDPLAHIPIDPRNTGLVFTFPDGAIPASEVVESTGITYRQLDYWTTEDIVQASIADPGGSGKRRAYSAEDAADVRTVAALVEIGFNVHALRQYDREQRARLHRACLSALTPLGVAG